MQSQGSDIKLWINNKTLVAPVQRGGEAESGGGDQGDWGVVPVLGQQRGGGQGPGDLRCHQAHRALYVHISIHILSTLLVTYLMRTVIGLKYDPDISIHKVETSCLS